MDSIRLNIVRAALGAAGLFLSAVQSGAQPASPSPCVWKPKSRSAKSAVGSTTWPSIPFATDCSWLSLAIIPLESLTSHQAKSSTALRQLTEPQGIGYELSTDTLFVANGGDGSVRMFRGGDLGEIGRIELGATQTTSNRRPGPTRARGLRPGRNCGHRCFAAAQNCRVRGPRAPRRASRSITPPAEFTSMFRRRAPSSSSTARWHSAGDLASARGRRQLSDGARRRKASRFRCVSGPTEARRVLDHRWPEHGQRRTLRRCGRRIRRRKTAPRLRELRAGLHRRLRH